MGKIILNDIEYGIGISNGVNVDTTNLVKKDSIVTTLDDTVTDKQIPSAKAVYDKLSDLPTDSGSKCYTTLDELGLTADATVDDVIGALKEGESFIGDTSLFTNVLTMFPNDDEQDQFAVVRIEKQSFIMVILEWFRKDGTAYAIGGIGDDGKFNGWKRVTNGGTVDLTDINTRLTQLENNTGGGTGGVGDVVIDNASISMGRKSGTTIGNYSTALGLDVEASGKCSHAEGSRTIASGDYSHAEGRLTEAIGESSHAEGSGTTASGTASHAEGSGTTASKYASHAEGYYTTASGNYSHSEGNYTTASGDYSHAEGYRTTASGDYSHAEGNGTIASKYASHAGGYYTKANDYQYTIGHYNVDTTGGKSDDTTGSAFVIGNGKGDTTSLRKNAFRVAYTGATYGAGAYNTSGADYAEYFEWIDGNVDNEDRRGLFVTLDGDKIKLANDGDYILGVVSSNPVVLGNSDMEWQGRFLKDKFGSLRIEKQIIKDVDEQGNEIEKEVEWYITNPEYDPNLEYVERKDRQEWTPVGFMGQLVVIDDGTCVVNGYCKCGVNGVATKADNGYRVMKRIDENTILVLIK